jgi:hypothetical protein
MGSRPPPRSLRVFGFVLVCGLAGIVAFVVLASRSITVESASRAEAERFGLPVKDLCRKHGFSEASYYLWRSKFGGMSVSDAKRLKELEPKMRG